MESTEIATGSDPRARVLKHVSEECVPFSLFSRFPADIRAHIWEKALSDKRYIEVELSSNCEEASQDRRCYDIKLSVQCKMSKLLSTTFESRRAALAFYRIQLPCFYELQDGSKMRGIFYICPELDTLMVKGLNHFEQFAHDVWTHDPRRIGFVNLAINVRANDALNHVQAMQVQNRDRLGQSLSRIECHTIRGNVVHTCLLELQYWRRGDTVRKARERFLIPRSSGGALRVNRITQDPRLRNAEDLQSICLGGTDPRWCFNSWLDLLASLNVCHKHKVQYSFILSEGVLRMDRCPKVTNMVKALELAETQVRRLEEKIDIDMMVYRYAFQESEHARFYQPLTVGFWLFPIDCLGNFPINVGKMHTFSDWYGPKVLNIAKYKPQLCLGIIH